MNLRMRQTLLTLCTAAALHLAAPPVHADAAPPPTAAQIVAAADQARGGGLPGVQWDVVITTEDPDSDDKVRKLTVRADADDSLAETTYPARAAGTRLLQLGHNMWFARPDLQRPVAISARQKMLGPAATGDVAATNYARDYDARLLREDSLAGEPVYVLELRAKNRLVTYDAIIYWVSQQRLLPVQAEFLTLSGKVLKTATFEMGNRIDFHGRHLPFVSRMTIRDATNAASVSVLDYANVGVR